MAETFGRGVGDHRGIGGSASLDNGLVGDILLQDYFSAAFVPTVYLGAKLRAAVYLGTRTDGQLYLGTGQLFP